MKKTKLIAAVVAFVMAGGAVNTFQQYMPNNALTADAADTEITLYSRLEESFYSEFKQGSENKALSLSLNLYDVQATRWIPIKFNEILKEYDFDLIFDDKNVVVQKKELYKYSNDECARPQVYLKIPEDTPLGEYSFKVVTKKAIDINGNDITSKFSDYNGKYSILDKDGKDTGRPDPAAEIIRINGLKRTPSLTDNNNLAPNERILTNSGYQVSGNINGKDHYFKEFDYTVEFDDKKVIVLEKELSVEPFGNGPYFFYPTFKIRIPDDTPDGKYNCKLTVNKAIDLNGKDITDTLPGKTWSYYYVVKSSEAAATETTTTTTAKKTTTTTTTTSAITTTTTTTKSVVDPVVPYTPKMGDPSGDGKIDAIDASIVLNVYAKLATNRTQAAKDELTYCDVNKDGKVNAIDASYVLSYYAYTSTFKGTENDKVDFVTFVMNT